MTLIKSPVPRVPKLFSDFFDMDRHFLPELWDKDFFKTVPSVNIVESQNDFRVELAVPGMKKNDFKINIENNVLSISAERKEEKEEMNERYTRKEFYYGSFDRSFTLPEAVIGDKIEAKYENGILRLVLPKKEEAKRTPVKEIKIS